MYPGCVLGEVSEQLHLPSAARYRVQHKANPGTQKCQYHEPGREHGGRQSRHQPGLKECDDDRYLKTDRDDGSNQAEYFKKGKWTLGTIKIDERNQDPKAIAPGVEI